MHGTIQTTISHDADAWSGYQAADRWEARILIEDLDTSFGLLTVLATVEGDGDDWTLWSIEIPTDALVTVRYARTGRWFREDWEQIGVGGLNQSPTDRRITAAVRAWLETDDRDPSEFAEAFEDRDAEFADYAAEDRRERVAE